MGIDNSKKSQLKVAGLIKNGGTKKQEFNYTFTEITKNFLSKTYCKEKIEEEGHLAIIFLQI